MYKVVTPWALIMGTLLDQIQARYSGAVFRFEPSLEFVDAVKGTRAIRHSLDLKRDTLFPLFVFNRGNLLPYEGAGRRFEPLFRKEGIATNMKARMCQVEVTFRVYSRDSVFADTFEVLYANREAVNEVQTMAVTLPELGSFPFYLEWRDLSGITFNKTDAFYVGVDFSVLVYGQFILLDDAPVSLIEHINLKIKNFQSLVLARTTLGE